jgi:hypothetical protein
MDQPLSSIIFLVLDKVRTISVFSIALSTLPKLRKAGPQWRIIYLLSYMLTNR